MDKLLPGITQLNTDLAERIRDGTFETLLILDIDQFHQPNTEHGPETGDRVLALVERVVKEGSWDGYRMGGNQFALIGSEAQINEGKVRSALALLSERCAGVRVTLSAGGVRGLGDDLGNSPETVTIIYAAASDALVMAKQQGRDRVLWLPDEEGDSADVTAATARLYRELARVNAAKARKAEFESRIDGLTGLFNRRGFDDIFSRLVEGSQRGKRALCLIFIDSDSLKRINDIHGHEAGDRFIIDLSSILRGVVRGMDFIFRWGGDEFIVLLEGADTGKARALADRIKAAVEERTEGTVSIGIYMGIPENIEDPVNSADRALYKAKRSGGNRVEIASA
ncbi:MAG: hypothetical protein CME15_05765 [Gemmatimonadetes bacterium]|nr:hypothetical protein [Gemmatimonadota bacterium]